MTNTSDSDPNFNIPFASSNVTLPSYNQTPRKKRTKISNNETGASSSSKRKPVKKPDPNAPKITRPCTECGRQFWSWKALFGHMRCHPERQWRGINPPPNHQRRTTSSDEEREVASCLLMMADEWIGPSEEVEERFECGGCKKVFGSQQALDAHKATHEHVTRTITEVPPPAPPQQIVDQDRKRKSVKLVSGIKHRCNICSRVYPSGQALGGHMRFHWGRDREKNQDSTGIDLNVPATEQDLPCSSSDTLSLDLRLGI